MRIECLLSEKPCCDRVALVSRGLAQTYQPARLGIYRATHLRNGRYFYTKEEGRPFYTFLGIFHGKKIRTGSVTKLSLSCSYARMGACAVLCALRYIARGAITKLPDLAKLSNRICLAYKTAGVLNFSHNFRRELHLLLGLGS